MRVDASATQSPPPSTHSHAHVPKKHARTGPLCVPELPGQSAQSSTQARRACARTACASTPVPRKAPHPAHIATRMCPKNTHKSTCAGSGPMRTALCCFHGAHRNTMRGSYTGAGIHGHWPAPKTSRKPTPACIYKHGKSARVRWPRVPIGAVCAHTGDRATWVRRGSRGVESTR
jgi:hypothetical protein